MRAVKGTGPSGRVFMGGIICFLFVMLGSDVFSQEMARQGRGPAEERSPKPQLKTGRVILMPDMREDPEFKRSIIEQKNIKKQAVERTFSMINMLNEGFKKSKRAYIRIDPARMPAESRAILDNIVSVNGVKVEIPGNYLGAAYFSGKSPDSSTEKGNNIYTLDDISVIKTREGNFYLSGEAPYMKHMKDKSLVLKAKAENELEDVTFLASALVKWATLDGCGYRLDKRSRDLIRKSVLTIYNGEDPSKRIREFESSLDIFSAKNRRVKRKISRFIFGRGE